MRSFLFLAMLTFFVACASDVTSPEPEREMWAVTASDGTTYVFDSEPELLDKVSEGGTCWHWTYDQGRWWARHCGLTLAEECYTVGPYGMIVDCASFGPGGNW